MYSSTKDPQRLVVGHVLGPWGLRGHVKVENLSDIPERFESGHSFLIGDHEYSCEEVIIRARGLVVKFHNVNNREQAATIQGAILEIPISEAPPLADGHYYYHQILGLEVLTLEGLHLGYITEIIPTGSNDVYVVQGSTREILIPAIDGVVESVNLEESQLRINPLPGLL